MCVPRERKAVQANIALVVYFETLGRKTPGIQKPDFQLENCLGSWVGACGALGGKLVQQRQ
jgi:hypothetical protein